MTNRIRTVLAALGLVALGTAAPGGLGRASTEAASTPLAVVELFTSQGCSSCPPADALLAEIARGRPELLVLSLPVDYWDYLGWRDTLAQPGFSQRQRAYAALRRDRQVYTPQAVVNGRDPCIGSNRADLEALIARAAKAGLPVGVTLTEENGVLRVEVGARRGSAEGLGEVWLVPVTRSQQVEIARGENRGRSVTYANVGRGLIRLGAWRGEAARFEVPVATARPPSADGFVVLVHMTQAGRPGPIVGAQRSAGL